MSDMAASTGFRPLYADLGDRVTRDGSWKQYAACGNKPKVRCRRCKKFDDTHPEVQCKCKHPQFEPLDQHEWVEFFYPDRGADFSSPKKVCERCPSKKSCLAFAIRTHETFGIWGGLTERERRRVRMDRDLWVICVFCNGKVKAGQWSRKTCNRQNCKDRWADEKTGIDRPGYQGTCIYCGFEMKLDQPARVCNSKECQERLASGEEQVIPPWHDYVIISEEALDLDDVRLDGIPTRLRRSSYRRRTGRQLALELDYAA